MKKSPTKQFVLAASKLKNLNLSIFETLKKKFAKKFGMDLFSNTLILETYQKLVKTKFIPKNKILRELLTSKKTRTTSGIASIACFTKPYSCPGECIYCPKEPQMPKSYLSDEPAVMRAIRCDFDPKKQKKKNQKNLLDPNIVKKPNNIQQIKDLENGWGMRHKNCRNK